MMLLAENYQVPIGNEREVITAYATVRNRRVRTAPRTVHKAAYQVPAHLSAGESQLLGYSDTALNSKVHFTAPVFQTLHSASG